MKISISNKKNKKYDVVTPSGRIISFGDIHYQQFHDSTPIRAYSYLDHNDKMRRELYLKRAMKIRDKNGKLTANNPESANFYAIRYLWSGP